MYSTPTYIYVYIAPNDIPINSYLDQSNSVVLI